MQATNKSRLIDYQTPKKKEIKIMKAETFPVPCPLSWLTGVGKGGKTTEKFPGVRQQKSSPVCCIIKCMRIKNLIRVGKFP